MGCGRGAPGPVPVPMPMRLAALLCAVVWAVATATASGGAIIVADERELAALLWAPRRQTWVVATGDRDLELQEWASAAAARSFASDADDLAFALCTDCGRSAAVGYDGAGGGGVLVFKDTQQRDGRCLLAPTQVGAAAMPWGRSPARSRLPAADAELERCTSLQQLVDFVNAHVGLARNVAGGLSPVGAAARLLEREAAAAAASAAASAAAAGSAHQCERVKFSELDEAVFLRRFVFASRPVIVTDAGEALLGGLKI